MEQKLYTIEEVAEILNLHHKTIRRYITNGDLRANKVGKQWRISGHELSVFLEASEINLNFDKSVEDQTIEYTTNGNVILEEIKVSIVVDINHVTKENYSRISNSLLAVMNTQEINQHKARINMKYLADTKNLKIMLWCDLDVSKELLDIIKIVATN